MALTIRGTAPPECITVRTLAGTTLADSMAGTVGSMEVAGITEFEELMAQPILAVRF